MSSVGGNEQKEETMSFRQSRLENSPNKRYKGGDQSEQKVYQRTESDSEAYREWR